MTNVVTTLRALARAALVTAVPDVNWPVEHWKKIGLAQLPRGGVGTPRVQTRRIDTDWVERVADLVVVVKRTGGADLEDVLDADADTVEQAMMSVLATLSDDFDLVETRAGVDAGGNEDIAEMSMLFRVVLRTAEGNPN